MKITYLDLQTGKKAQDSGISVYELTDGNWSCDCNRALAFDDGIDSSFCDGCKRYIVIDVQAEEMDPPELNSEEVIKEANAEYYMKQAS